ncbi:SAM-dependent methyltransferase [Longispora fulva]|uniref:SAM-dependent methyltransferase n=1 Tax=Longispora fulva TaxID=619741 RepID=A0A8J7KK11_9ACTN|nr:class I SAM-dependent methyltransferase [Longispora fulva]MBG6140880.1 SAM-dependent methyltransferase [Longispora fulva]GIG60854.1 SAM-dependent methyltransferase [Longispora fulva]
MTRQHTSELTCEACGALGLTPCADLGLFPATCGMTWPEPPTDPVLGRMDLWYCPSCAHVVNRAFTEDLRATDGLFDNGMLSSASYRAHVAGVAERVLGRALPTRTLELGCGEGELLELLPGERTGWSRHVPEPTTLGGYTLNAGSWTPGAGAYDLVVARHVLEHVADPLGLLRQLRSVTDGRGYFEVPDAGYDLGAAGWDVIYPHAQYFHAGSLVAMCERAGFTVTNYGLTFHDQYLYVEVSTHPGAERAEACVDCGPLDNDHQRAVAQNFGDRFGALIDRWQGVVKAHHRPALWGAGARGLTFLATVDPGHAMTVVDLNPGKHGRFLATGHRVDPPSSLPPDTDVVIITNPAYQKEIERSVAELGVTCEVLVA